ncbi:MAG: hypothetical protein HOW97_12290 [Catenulispora sp.]|nr:hypothetical protein [Catenulispora sp.]
MTTTATRDTAHHDLQAIIDSWPHLLDMLTTRHGQTWPPAMGIQHALNSDDDQAAAEERAQLRLAERADSRYTLGASPAPIRLAIVDVIRTVEPDLVYAVDVLAQEIQRPVMAKAPAHWLPEDQERREKLRTEDAADPRRWRYRENRTAPHAAAWLLGRIEAQPGPFLPLGPTHVRRIAGVAGAAHARIRRALDGDRTAQVVDRPCPLCGGTLGMSSGDGHAPLVVCFGCRQEWTLAVPEVA